MTSSSIERTGAAPTATGPEDAKAERPASLHNPIKDLEPAKVMAEENVNDENSNQIAPLEKGDAECVNASGDDTPGDPASPPIDGADLFERIHAFLCRFVLYPSAAASVLHLLWIVHAHLMDAWQSTPRLAFVSPEAGSGKSRAMEMTGLLVPRPLLSVNSTPAFIMRSVGDPAGRPTILYDEIDTVFGPKAGGNEELRGLINAGYRRGATVGRCVVSKTEIGLEQFETYCAVAMAGLGNLPDTIQSRSVMVRMRKRAPDEIVEPYRQRFHEPLGHALRDELELWAESVIPMAEGFVPSMPPGIEDRNADVYEPLIAVADLAGGKWPELARAAALEHIREAKADNSPSLGAQLLADIRRCFGDEDRMATADLLKMLLNDEEAPWGDLSGKKLDARKLARMLRDFGIKSTTIRLPDNTTPKGYRREAFHDAWKRYLPASEKGATSATSATNPDLAEDCGGKSSGSGGDVADGES